MSTNYVINSLLVATTLLILVICIFKVSWKTKLGIIRVSVCQPLYEDLCAFYTIAIPAAFDNSNNIPRNFKVVLDLP